MKTIGFFLVLLFLSTSVSVSAQTEPDKFTTHCSVMSFLDQLEMIDPGIYDAIEKGILEGKSTYKGERGSLGYKICVSSMGKETDITVILLNKNIKYARCNFVFRNSKLQSAMLDVFLDDEVKTNYYFHFYLKRDKHLSYYRKGEGDYHDFSAELFAEHLQKITPL